MSTPELDQFLKRMHDTGAKLENGVWHEPIKPQTVAGIGPGTWDRNALANAQGQHAGKLADKATAESIGLFKSVSPAGAKKTVYRVYTQDINRNATLDIVRRYVEGATVLYGVGLDSRTQEHDENAVAIEVVTSKPDAFQRILDLAGDIRVCNSQISVLVTQHSVTTFEVTETTATKGTL